MADDVYAIEKEHCKLSGSGRAKVKTEIERVLKKILSGLLDLPEFKVNNITLADIDFALINTKHLINLLVSSEQIYNIDKLSIFMLDDSYDVSEEDPRFDEDFIQFYILIYLKERPDFLKGGPGIKKHSPTANMLSEAIKQFSIFTPPEFYEAMEAGTGLFYINWRSSEKLDSPCNSLLLGIQVMLDEADSKYEAHGK